MHLVPDAGKILRHAWSIRLILAAAVLSGLEVALAIAGPFLPVRPGVFAAVSMLVTMGAFVARFVAQSTVSGGDK
jgi:hypothetical protein